ncbi:hypothetical protein E3N88_15753 [Mikania micrantha]|uniref:ACT domain-containing protein n=1 Tax=Mikania micrantha TaxID=192012 RepID=A0A5N6NYK2_9ASTR|nr:hypothetical protein E3N88_15753 [Mikania micrantha]
MSVLRRISSTTLSFPRVLESVNRSFNTLPEPSPPLVHGIHVLYCPDSVGIVAKISECIASRGGNILEADVFVPQNKNVFYSRSEFVFDPVKWPRAQMDEDVLKLSKKFNASKSVVRVPSIDPKYKIAVLASKQDHCLVDLLLAWQDGKLPIDISSIISNHDRIPNSHVMRFLERNEISYHYLPTTNENKREDEILQLVQDTDFLVLARYMQPRVRVNKSMHPTPCKPRPGSHGTPCYAVLAMLCSLDLSLILGSDSCIPTSVLGSPSVRVVNLYLFGPLFYLFYLKFLV